MNNKNFSTFMLCFIVFIYIFLAIILYSFFVGRSVNENEIKNQNNEYKSGNQIENGNNLIIEDVSITGVHTSDFAFIEDCLIQNTGDYKIINIFSGVKQSPLDAKDYVSYTNMYNIQGTIIDAKLCIVSDIVDYRKVHQYTYTTYVIFNEPEYAGHLNVGYSIKNQVMYDKNSGGSSELNGRFRGDETPKIYNLYDLSNVIVANTKDGGTKKINILDRLQKEGQIRIGGFMNAKNGEGRINKFVLAYKCKEGTYCSIESF